jgi:hypothetical protein
MGFPAKLLAEGERPLVVLRPHVRRLARPALILLALAPLGAYAVAAVPRGAAQGPARAVVAALAGLVAVRWVVVPFLLWWNTLYVLTDARVFERQGVVRRSGHDLPLRGVSDVVVAQKLGERLLRCGTLTVTTEGGARLAITDVPAVSRLHRSLLAVADDVAERARAADGERWGRRVGRPDDDLDDLGDLDDPDDLDEPDGLALDGTVRESLPGAAHEGVGWDGERREDDEVGSGPSRREARRRDRESIRRLRALQAEVRRAPHPDSPLEDDGLDQPKPEPPASSPGGPDGAQAWPTEVAEAEQTQGARVLRFPRRP